MSRRQSRRSAQASSAPGKEAGSMRRARPPSEALIAPSPAAWKPIHWAGTALIFLLLALFGLRQIGNTDTGFHLRTGEYILEGHAPPATDPFSFTMQDHAYTDTSWGYDVLVA